MRQFHVGFFVAATLSLTTIVGCAAEPAGEESEAVGESEDHLLAGRRIPEREAAQILRNAGFPDAAVGKMLCAIKYESNFYEKASNKNRNGSSDYGLLQINSIHLGSSGCPSSASALYNAATNAKCALRIYNSQGINAWYGYQKHRTEWNSYRAPSGSAAATGNTTPDNDDDASEGGCYSGTLGEMVAAKTCVESKFDPGWYQCKEGKWYAGGSSGTGPFGACSSKHPR